MSIGTFQSPPTSARSLPEIALTHRVESDFSAAENQGGPCACQVNLKQDFKAATKQPRKYRLTFF